MMKFEEMPLKEHPPKKSVPDYSAKDSGLKLESALDQDAPPRKQELKLEAVLDQDAPSQKQEPDLIHYAKLIPANMRKKYEDKFHSVLYHHTELNERNPESELLSLITIFCGDTPNKRKFTGNEDFVARYSRGLRNEDLQNFPSYIHMETLIKYDNDLIKAIKDAETDIKLKQLHKDYLKNPK